MWLRQFYQPYSSSPRNGFMQCRCLLMRARYQISKAMQPPVVIYNMYIVQQCLIYHAVASTAAAGTSLHYALIWSKNTLNNAGWFQNRIMHLCVMHLSGVNCTLFKTRMDGLVFYAKARAFKTKAKAKAGQSQDQGQGQEIWP